MKKLYRKLGTENRDCEWGSHTVAVYAVRAVEPTGEFETRDAGYGPYEAQIFVDRRGNRYREERAVDFSAEVRYFGLNDSGWWSGHLPPGPAIDYAGNRIQ